MEPKLSTTAIRPDSGENVRKVARSRDQVAAAPGFDSYDANVVVMGITDKNV
jgi:hypothetical protein